MLLQHHMSLPSMGCQRGLPLPMPRPPAALSALWLHLPLLSQPLSGSMPDEADDALGDGLVMPSFLGELCTATEVLRFTLVGDTL